MFHSLRGRCGLEPIAQIHESDIAFVIVHFTDDPGIIGAIGILDDVAVSRRELEPTAQVRDKRNVNCVAIIGTAAMEDVERLLREESSMPAVVTSLEVALFANSEPRAEPEQMLAMTPIHKLHRSQAQIAGISVVVEVNVEIRLVEDHHLLHAGAIDKREIVIAVDPPPPGQTKFKPAAKVGRIAIPARKGREGSYWRLIAALQVASPAQESSFTNEPVPIVHADVPLAVNVGLIDALTRQNRSGEIRRIRQIVPVEVAGCIFEFDACSTVSRSVLGRGYFKVEVPASGIAKIHIVIYASFQAEFSAANARSFRKKFDSRRENKIGNAVHVIETSADLLVGTRILQPGLLFVREQEDIGVVALLGLHFDRGLP